MRGSRRIDGYRGPLDGRAQATRLGHALSRGRCRRCADRCACSAHACNRPALLCGALRSPIPDASRIGHSAQAIGTPDDTAAASSGKGSKGCAVRRLHTPKTLFRRRNVEGRSQSSDGAVCARSSEVGHVRYTALRADASHVPTIYHDRRWHSSSTGIRVPVARARCVARSRGSWTGPPSSALRSSQCRGTCRRSV